MSDRITGKDATISYNGVTIAELFDPKISIDPKYAESLGWITGFTVRDGIGNDAKITASRYNTVASFGLLILQATLGAASTASLIATVYAKKGASTIIAYQGPVKPGTATMSLSKTEHAVEDIEWLADGPPTTVAGVAVTGV